MFIQIAENMFHSDAKNSNTKKQIIPTLDIYFRFLGIAYQ